MGWWVGVGVGASPSMYLPEVNLEFSASHHATSDNGLIVCRDKSTPRDAMDDPTAKPDCFSESFLLGKWRSCALIMLIMVQRLRNVQ